METRASNILVGGFVLFFLAGLVGFSIWIAKVDLDAEYTDYDIYFDGTVSGLYKRSVVYYSGIPVGDVRDITLAPNDAQKVRVWIRLKAEVPVTEGATARLEFQGLTGVAYIELKGGPPGGAPLLPFHEQERAVIEAEFSAYQAVFEGAPNLLNQAIKAVVQVQRLLSDENVASVTSLLHNADTLSANLARGTNDIEAVVAEARTVLAKASQAAESVSLLAASGNKLLEQDAEQLVAEATTAMQDAQKLLQRVDRLVAANEENVTQFVSGSLPELSRMILDLRSTSQSLSRLMGRIEKNPAEVIFGNKEKKYNLKTRRTTEEDQ
ncbi:MAG: MCE family protein [Kordiimonadaceae bacterium]|nr:MCE family protein [Kordiimonadaceae bacterium]